MIKLKFQISGEMIQLMVLGKLIKLLGKKFHFVENCDALTLFFTCKLTS